MEQFKEFDYKQYWEDNYINNGTSGVGSYGLLAEFKGDVINKVIEDNDIESIIDFGCGDGNQLKYIVDKKYLGVDISRSVIERCKTLFKDDKNKSFLVYDSKNFNAKDHQADVSICLDVLYHIIDEEDFIKTLDNIFLCAKKMVIIYTKITVGYSPREIDTIKDRPILEYLKKYENFQMKDVILQKYPNKSASNFLIFKRVNQ